jgi:hypothetical protein
MFRRYARERSHDCQRGTQFSQRWELTEMVGQTPGLRGSPWTRRSATKQADEGVGCGPGGPPHFQCKLRDIGKTECVCHECRVIS